MATIRDLKKDINSVLGGIIEAVYIAERTSNKEGSKEGSEIIDKAIATFDSLIAEVNKKDVDNRKKHLKGVRQTLEKEASELVDRVNQLA